jgi:AhpD family alkylhydroperoxidase
MLAVNSVNACPYCTSLHGELGRMAGLADKTKSINEAKDAAALKKVNADPMVTFCVFMRVCMGVGKSESLTHLYCSYPPYR